MMKTIALAALLATAFALPAMAEVSIPTKDQARFGELREKHGAHPIGMEHKHGKVHKAKNHCAKKAAAAATPEYAAWELKKCQGKVKTWKETKGKPFHEKYTKGGKKPAKKGK
jgi:hypothetical protein